MTHQDDISWRRVTKNLEFIPSVDKNPPHTVKPQKLPHSGGHIFFFVNPAITEIPLVLFLVLLF